MNNQVNEQKENWIFSKFSKKIMKPKQKTNYVKSKKKNKFHNIFDINSEFTFSKSMIFFSVISKKKTVRKSKLFYHFKIEFLMFYTPVVTL